MEELLEKFSSGLNADLEETRQYRLSQFRNHDFSSLNQETRRNLLLSRQKKMRQDEIDARRGILEVLHEVEQHEEESTKKVYKPSLFVPGFHERQKDLLNTLMLSEWFIEAPKDLLENWLVLACPKGARVLLIASKGKTKTFNKLGKHHKTWLSVLPGGNSDSGEFKKSCVLDCIWSEATQSIYVLDMLMWVNQPMTDCDMDFRNSWLKSKFSENPSLSEVSDRNNYPIYLLPKYNCDASTLQKFMTYWPPFCENNPCVDGFLFYHKNAHYISGTTPLAGWIYPYMINEVLGSDIILHEEYLKMKPEKYENMTSFIEAFEEKQAAKRMQIEKRDKKNIFQNSKMNISLSPKTNNTESEVFAFSADNNGMEIQTKKRKPRKKHNRKNNMDIELNISADSTEDSNIDRAANTSSELDSAVSSMEDSILEETKNENQKDSCQNDSAIVDTMDC